MSQKFELVAPFKPTGDQPQAIERLMKGLKTGQKDQVLLGVTGSGKSLTPKMPVWIYEENVGNFKPRLVPIGEYTDGLFESNSEAAYLTQDGTEILPIHYLKKKIYVPSLNPVTKSVELKPIYAVTRHKAPKKLYNVETNCGRTVEVTGDHNFYVLRDGKWLLVKTDEIKKGDFLPVPICFDAFVPSKGKRRVNLLSYSITKPFHVTLNVKAIKITPPLFDLSAERRSYLY